MPILSMQLDYDSNSLLNFCTAANRLTRGYLVIFNMPSYLPFSRPHLHVRSRR